MALAFHSGQFLSQKLEKGDSLLKLGNKSNKSCYSTQASVWVTAKPAKNFGLGFAITPVPLLALIGCKLRDDDLYHCAIWLILKPSVLFVTGFQNGHMHTSGVRQANQHIADL